MTLLNFNTEKAVRHFVYALISEHISFVVKYFTMSGSPYWSVEYDESNLKFDD